MSGRLPGIPTRKFVDALEEKGFKKDRCNSGHDIYERTITESVSVPIHSKEIKGAVARKISKKYNLGLY